jgi:Cu/Ag efflux protein CusF
MSNSVIGFTTRQVSVLLLGTFGLALIACQSHEPPPQKGRFQLHGIVVSIEKSEHGVIVKHDEIPGFMSAMTMSYEVADQKDLDKVSPGDEVRADVVLNEGSVRLEKITIVKRSTGQ